MEKAIEKSRKKLAEVKTALAAFDWKNNISIYGGKCGYLIFLNELMKYEKPGSQYETQIETLCEDIFNDVQSHDFNATFGNGMAGVVYTLSRIGLTEAIDREILEWIEQQAVKLPDRIFMISFMAVREWFMHSQKPDTIIRSSFSRGLTRLNKNSYRHRKVSVCPFVSSTRPIPRMIINLTTASLMA